MIIFFFFFGWEKHKWYDKKSFSNDLTIGLYNIMEIKKILKEFQLMASAPNDSSLSSNQDTNQFLV